MKRTILLFLFLLLSCSPLSCKAAENRMAPVIIDTDYSSDCDDILALKLALEYQRQGAIEIRGICASASHSQITKAISCVCEYNGYTSIPIAQNHNHIVHAGTNYIEVLASKGGHLSDMDTTKLYRKLLAESDEKVTIVTLGFLQNMQDLMYSQPDEYSQLNGMELMKERVSSIFVLGGNLKDTPSFNFYWTGDTVINAAVDVDKNCPVDIYYMPTELGGDVWNNNRFSKNDPIYSALVANHQSKGIVGWDTMGIFTLKSFLCNEMDDNQLHVLDGKSYISNTGAFSWTNLDTPTTRHLVMKTNPGDYYSYKIDSILFQ